VRQSDRDKQHEELMKMLKKQQGLTPTQHIGWLAVGVGAWYAFAILVPILSLAIAVFLHSFFPEIMYEPRVWWIAYIAIGLVFIDILRSIFGNWILLVVAIICVVVLLEHTPLP